MIQRVQTLYLAIVIILLSIVTMSTEFFSFLNETHRFVFTSFGIQEYDLATNELVGSSHFTFYVGLISLVLLAFITLMSYKNLKRQFKLGRAVFLIYFIMLITVFTVSIFGNVFIDEPTSKREMGLGFFLFVAGFPFSFLANLGIKRDKKLLESVDRLR